MSAADAPTQPLSELLAIMARLRDPETGCPWDVEQTFKTIAPYTIEEAYEVADAIEREDMDELKDELGDLLLQVVFHAQMAQEAGLFDFDDVCRAINDKMVRRHPHVFGDAIERDSETQTESWEAQKAEERKTRKKATSALDDVPIGLPALKRAQKLQKRAGRVGFDWPDAERVLAKVDEELAEIRDAIEGGMQEHIAEEVGDFVFVAVNLGRKLKVDVEGATRSANAKFERRFRHIEQRLAAQERRTEDASLEEMEALWDEAKHLEKSSAQAVR